MKTYEIEYNNLTSRYDVCQVDQTSTERFSSLIQSFIDKKEAELYVHVMTSRAAESEQLSPQKIDFLNNPRDHAIRQHVLASLTPQIAAKCLSIDGIAEAFFHKIGGMPSQDSVERLIEKVYEEEKKLHAQDTIRMVKAPSRKTPTNYIELIEKAIRRLPGVTGSTVLVDNYPESASMIIKLKMEDLTDDESVQTMEAIGAAIKRHKPHPKLKFEVIYHTTEVY